MKQHETSSTHTIEERNRDFSSVGMDEMDASRKWFCFRSIFVEWDWWIFESVSDSIYSYNLYFYGIFIVIALHYSSIHWSCRPSKRIVSLRITIHQIDRISSFANCNRMELICDMDHRFESITKSYVTRNSLHIYLHLPRIQNEHQKLEFNHYFPCYALPLPKWWSTPGNWHVQSRNKFAENFVDFDASKCANIWVPLTR